MPAIVLDNQLSTGHACFPPTSISASSSKTQVNSKNVALHGDLYAPHSCGTTVHESSVRNGISGASKTKIEGKLPLRIGDNIACGDVCAEGSNNTFIE
jgi:uncharacterized Zn-binding protein involved in type VI secretion